MVDQRLVPGCRLPLHKHRAITQCCGTTSCVPIHGLPPDMSLCRLLHIGRIRMDIGSSGLPGT
jgi:hypothetical protein